MATPEPSTNCLCSIVQFLGNHACGWFFRIVGPVWGFGENFINLDENMDKLKGDTEYLSSQGKDKKDELRNKERPGKKAKQEVVTWLRNVDRTEKEVKRFEEDVEGSNCVKRLWLAQQVQGKIDKVAEVKGKGTFPDGLVIDATQGLLIPMEDFFSEAASARNCEKVRKCLTEHKFTKIGVVGMGGAGKTTIMKQIHNEMIEGTAYYFDEVVWVMVSKGFSIEKLQNTIAMKLKVDDDTWKCMDEMSKTMRLCTTFSQKRYLLILDDVWESFPLEKVGVSSSSNVTVVLTTRLKKEVSERMGCKTIEIDLLTEQEANDLFMGTIALDVDKLTPEVNNIVGTIAKKCARLPLAIMTIARNMRETEDIDAWRDQLDQISRKEFKDKYADVLEVLRFSYNRLENGKLKECFLYCALYPEDHDIPRNELIEYWIMEGLIDEKDSREAMFHRGHRILNELIGTNLLERAHGECVRVHDLIREMSLTIIGTRFHSGDRLFEEDPFEVWSQDRERVFLNDNWIRVLPLRPLCPQLTTLLLRWSFSLEPIPDSFFLDMPGLKVLDLSFTGIRSLPKSISDLENLRALLAGGCDELEYVPSLEKLKELKELILCRSKILEVPEGLEELVNLRNLDLFGTSELESFDSWKLRRLSKLQRLRIDGSKVKVSARDLLCLNKLEVVGAEFQNGQELISYLASPQFQRLKKYGLYVESYYLKFFSRDFEQTGNEVGVVGRLETFVGRQVFPSNLAKIYIEGCEFDIKIGSSDIMPWNNIKDLRTLVLTKCNGIELIFSENCQTPLRSVEELRLSELPDLRVLFHGVAPPDDISFKLKRLDIWSCSGIKYIFPAMLLQNYFPNLEELQVWFCENVKEIIVDEDVEMSRMKTIKLPNLKKISLSFLPALEIIYKGTMVSTSLGTITVQECPKLKRLPFSCSRTDDDCQQHASPAPALPRIGGKEEWWESLEWDDDYTKTAFQTSFEIIYFW